MEKGIYFMENKIELGSEFNLSLNELHIVEDNLYSYMSNYSVQWYDYGRSALRHIPIPKGKNILLPEFICESVSSCFEKSRIRFYDIDENFNIDLIDLVSKLDKHTGCIYVVHYFGCVQSNLTLKKIKEIANEYEIIVIEDTTQSLFSTHEFFGDYILASVRKWMQIPMGGILYTNYGRHLPSQDGCMTNNDNARVYGMILKDMFLMGDYDTNVKYREIFVNAEKRVDCGNDVCKMSDLSRFLIACVDVNRLVQKRKHNTNRLFNGLKKMGIEGICEFDKCECPFAYPLRVRERDVFKKYLMDNRIYCAVHWPFDGIMPEKRIQAIENANSLISLPIDQRYGDKEIDYMIDVISKYGGELSF